MPTIEQLAQRLLTEGGCIVGTNHLNHISINEARADGRMVAENGREFVFFKDGEWDKTLPCRCGLT